MFVTFIVLQTHTSTRGANRPSACVASLPIFNDDDRVRAEVRWLLRVIETNQSFSSQEGMAKCFSAMFHDSKIAQNFSCSESKARYTTVHGLAPYLQQQLRDKVKSDRFVLLFDESLNKKLQQKQMDIHLRFWNGSQVETRYATSAFLGHADAATVVAALKESVNSLGVGLENVLQLGMDGPNVNWKVFDDLAAEIRMEKDTDLLNVGSCGLHVVHGAFKNAMEGTKWELEEILKAAYNLFNNTSARRDDFQRLTGSKEFPFKFAAHRWVENVSVLERMIKVLPALCQYVKAVHDKKLPSPGTHSFGVLSSECLSPLLDVKLKFALGFASIVQPFLLKYQTDKPALPFLVGDLLVMIKEVLQKFIRSDCLPKIQSCVSLRKNEFADKANHQQVDLGFSAEKALKNLMEVSKKVTESEVFSFRAKAKEAFICFIKKLMDKSPLAFPLARGLACLSPELMNTAPDASKKLFRRVLLTLVQKKRLNEGICDKVEREYAALVDGAAEAGKGDAFRDFSFSTQRLDEFLQEKMKMYPTAWSVVRELLLLSHGQATVERGFSYNKQVVVENQDEGSLIARRLVKDHITSAGGSRNVIINKEMVAYARSSYQRYSQHLEAEKERKVKEMKQRKRKAEEDCIEELKAKKARITRDIEVLYKGVKEYALKCEKTGNISFITQSNALREKAEKKETELKETESELREKLEVFRQ